MRSGAGQVGGTPDGLSPSQEGSGQGQSWSRAGPVLVAACDSAAEALSRPGLASSGQGRHPGSPHTHLWVL